MFQNRIQKSALGTEIDFSPQQAAAQKKSSTNLNAAATPAPDTADAPQEGPTPATPITPVNPASFAKNQNVNAGQVVPNGPPVPPPQLQGPPVPPPTHADPNFLDTNGMVSTRVTNPSRGALPADMSLGFPPRLCHQPFADRQCAHRFRLRLVPA